MSLKSAFLIGTAIVLGMLRGIMSFPAPGDAGVGGAIFGFWLDLLNFFVAPIGVAFCIFRLKSVRKNLGQLLGLMIAILIYVVLFGVSLRVVLHPFSRT